MLKKEVKGAVQQVRGLPPAAVNTAEACLRRWIREQQNARSKMPETACLIWRLQKNRYIPARVRHTPVTRGGG